MRIAQALIRRDGGPRPGRRAQRVLRDGRPPATADAVKVYRDDQHRGQPAALRDRRRGAATASTTTIDDAGLELGAIYHSHTRSAPYPSQTDINFANSGRGSLWIIVGLAGGEPEVRAYEIRDGQVADAELEIGLTVTERVRESTLVCPDARSQFAGDRAFLSGLQAAAGPAADRRGARLRVRASRARAQGQAAADRGRAGQAWRGRATNPRASSSRACCSRRACPACCAAAPGSTCPTCWPPARAT